MRTLLHIHAINVLICTLSSSYGRVSTVQWLSASIREQHFSSVRLPEGSNAILSAAGLRSWSGRRGEELVNIKQTDSRPRCVLARAAHHDLLQ